MWVRKRIDIGWFDLLAAATYCFSFRSRNRADLSTEAAWGNDGRAEACLSVRSGFDLVLGALDLPVGSEILVSAITIPDMVRIITHHGLVPVPIELCARNASPRIDALANATTAATKAILVAHLYGGRIDLDPIVEFARERGLLIFEDCAQAFEGDRYRGHEAADVSFFSFGPIKTATALGGGILRFKKGSLIDAVSKAQSQFPVQSRWRFLKRILFYLVLKWLSGRMVFGLFHKACSTLGFQLDKVLNGAVRGFRGSDLIKALRVQPSLPLLLLMKRRISNYSNVELDRRTAIGRLLTRLLPEEDCLGSAAVPHSFWVFPLRVSEKSAVITALSSAGFDASAESTLRIVEPQSIGSHLGTETARSMLESTIYLPVYSAMPESEVCRMADVLTSAASRE